MTVKDLMGLLQNQDPDNTVYAEDYYGNSYPIEGVTLDLSGDTVVTTGKKETR